MTSRFNLTRGSPSPPPREGGGSLARPGTAREAPGQPPAEDRQSSALPGPPVGSAPRSPK